jgi:excisionase family DNA binding protein
MQDRIMTPDQVAEMLQLHPFTILGYIKEGRLRAAKLGRVYRIRESDVTAFLESQIVVSLT